MKPITYKDNVSELVSISVKEAMQMLMDNDCKPVEVLSSDERESTLIAIAFDENCHTGLPFLLHARSWQRQIYRRENYIIGYNGEKLPPLPEGYGLMPNDRPKAGDCFYGKVAVTWCKPHWADCAMYDHCDLTLTYSCPIDSPKWRALFQPKPSIQLELGKWYECRDGSVVQVLGDGGLCGLYPCSDRAFRTKSGVLRLPIAREGADVIRAIDPELSVSLSNLDHETANKVWRARK